MPDLDDVLQALASQLAADPLVGLGGADPNAVMMVWLNGEWVTTKNLPGAAILAEEVEREAISPTAELATATILLQVTLDGRRGQGNPVAARQLATSLRRFLIEHRTLVVGDPPAALLQRSEPKGERYQVLGFGERGALQTVTVRWRAVWIEPRTFEDSPLVSERHLRTIRLTWEQEPAAGGTEEQP